MWKGGHYRFGNANDEDSSNLIAEQNNNNNNGRAVKEDENPLLKPKRKVEYNIRIQIVCYFV